MAVIWYRSVVSWLAQRQKSTAQSSMEAEIIAANEGGKEAAWMEKLTADLKERGPKPYIPTLYYDNIGRVDLIKDTKFHNKAKHIEIRYMFIRKDIVERKRMKVTYIVGKEQMADILTKQLPLDQYRIHCKSMGLDLLEA